MACKALNKAKIIPINTKMTINFIRDATLSYLKSQDVVHLFTLYIINYICYTFMNFV
ncbi:hypothetical protein SBF1_8060001 [Candidatus Desulfosporosinus infrequens]|uniref:Uncharacterized protein n=1 Tax=Candidatus Desulfosporosinus infrequens TaxID=2043169 RepID=A0A2U3LTQ0_9FIRM|nr:hypothetical protein SBF1_8060001 [Candidatus Desulfosporosinus infrequens]